MRRFLRDAIRQRSWDTSQRRRRLLLRRRRQMRHFVPEMRSDLLPRKLEHFVLGWQSFYVRMYVTAHARTYDARVRVCTYAFEYA
jgi:hypothetical protein